MVDNFCNIDDAYLLEGIDNESAYKVGNNGDEEKKEEYGDVVVYCWLTRRALFIKEMPQEEELTLTNSVVKRTLLSKVTYDMNQMENLFHSKCLIKGNMCFLIINGGSCANVESTTLVVFPSHYQTLYPLQTLIVE